MGVGMIVHDPEKVRAAARKAAKGELVLAPDGPVVERFEAKKVAAAIEQEIARSRVMGWTRITLHMDLDDALKLAHTLKRSR
jgi:hypothetical protein